jgi:hypothetical protein
MGKIQRGDWHSVSVSTRIGNKNLILVNHVNPVNKFFGEQHA